VRHAGGENVAPVLMEDAIKAECGAISNAVLLGDKRKYISALLTLKTEPDADGAPTIQLSEPSLMWTASIGSAVKTSVEATKCPKVRLAIADAITRANTKAISNAARVVRWELIPHDFRYDYCFAAIPTHTIV
jgi:long-chain-fatty-acid--CoA ligase ACSBG